MQVMVCRQRNTGCRREFVEHVIIRSSFELDRHKRAWALPVAIVCYRLAEATGKGGSSEARAACSQRREWQAATPRPAASAARHGTNPSPPRATNVESPCTPPPRSERKRGTSAAE